MNKIYVSGNYIIVEDASGKLTSYPKSKSEYCEQVDCFILRKYPNNAISEFKFSEIGTWFNEAGDTAYTITSLRTLLRENTDFNSASGSSGAVPITQSVAGYSNLVSGTEVGQIAYSSESEGTRWLPGTLGGTYYPKGFYMWDGDDWVSDRNAIANQFEINTAKLQDNLIIVKSESDIQGQSLDPSKIYKIDKDLTNFTQPILVPEAGLRLIADSTTKLNSSLDNFTLFEIDPAGTYSGRLIFKNLSFAVNGAGSQVFDLDNNQQTDNENNSIDWIFVDMIGCTSLGTILNYRQGFWDIGSIIFCSDGLTLNGIWSGGFRLTSNRTLNGSANPMIKAGVGLVMGGRFVSDCFYTAFNPNAVFCDFSPNNIQNDSDFQIIDGDFGGAVNALTGHFPNMPITSVKAFYDSKGIEKTNVGAKVTFVSEVATPITTPGTYVKALGTTVISNAQWTSDDGVNNRIKYISTQDVSGTVTAFITLESGTGDVVGAALYFFDSSQGTSTLIDEAQVEIPLFGTANLTLRGDVEVNDNDYFELHLTNSDTTPVIVKTNSKILLNRR